MFKWWIYFPKFTTTAILEMIINLTKTKELKRVTLLYLPDGTVTIKKEEVVNWYLILRNKIDKNNPFKIRII